MAQAYVKYNSEKDDDSQVELDTEPINFDKDHLKVKIVFLKETQKREENVDTDQI